MNQESTREKGLLLNLIESGLKIWLSKRCDYIEGLKIELLGSNIGLLKGNINSVKLTAEKAKYKDLPMHSIELNTDKIKLALEKKRIKLKEKFLLIGSISFEGVTLGNALVFSQWNWLGKWLTIKLVGYPYLKSLKIVNDELVLACTESKESILKTFYFSVTAKYGKIYISDKIGSTSIQIPMDESIDIDYIKLKDGSMSIFGKALVTP